MPVNPVKKAIKEAKFLKALVDTGGNATRAYKATVPHVTDGSAEVGGSKALSNISTQDVNSIFEAIGCTKQAVLAGLWERMKSKEVGFAEGTRILTKIGGWDKNSGSLHDILSRDLDLIEVVKIRLKKRSNTNDLQQSTVIDVSSTSSTSDEKQNSDEGQG